MPDIYIPPPGVFVRILGHDSGCVLVSRNYDPQVFQYSRQYPSDDQLFQLIPGTAGNHPGYYIIKSKVTGKVIYSRTTSDPLVYHIGGDGAYNDNWFKLEQGSGNLESWFRLVNASDTVLVFRKDTNDVANYPVGYKIYDDQYFSFLFEDTKIDRVMYHIDQGRILSSTQVEIATQTLKNDTDTEQTMEFNLSETENQTSTFVYTGDFTIAAGASGKAPIPFVSQGQIKLDANKLETFTWGSTISSTKPYKAHLSVVASAHSTVQVVATATRWTIEIPVTIYSKTVSNGAEVQTSGTYNGTGVTTWDLHCTMNAE